MHVVIIGGGFGGLALARELGGVQVEVTLVDRANHHLFQPLLYQVAMSGLSPADIAVPIRAVLRHQRNIRVLLDEAVSVDVQRREVKLRVGDPLRYDRLVIAAGAGTNYFGHPEWSHVAVGLKDLDEAVEIRRRVLLAFEEAEREPDPEKRKRLISFVVIGGGPTGVELAGALAELARFVVARDFRRVKPEDARVLLIEAGPRVLATFDDPLPDKAVEQLHQLGVEVRTGKPVTAVDAEGVVLGGDERIFASTVMWAAGVKARPLARSLGVPLDRGGRIEVGPDCSVPGHPEIFALGDIAHFDGPDGRPLPGLAPVAMQQGRFVARCIERDLRGEPRGEFRYRDKGVMATIGRSRAVAQSGKLKLSGFIAWLSWIFIHLWFLVGFRNRIAVFFNWFWGYITYKRGARLITGRRIEAGVPERTIEPSETELEVRAKQVAVQQRAREAPAPSRTHH